MDAPNGLENIARKTHKRRDTLVKQVVRDLKFVQGFSKHDTHRATSVHENTANIEVGNIHSNDQRVIVAENDTTLLLFYECNRCPSCLGHLWHAFMLSVEDFVWLGRPDILLDGVVGCASQSKATVDGRDHVNLALARTWGGGTLCTYLSNLPSRMRDSMMFHIAM